MNNSKSVAESKDVKNYFVYAGVPKKSIPWKFIEKTKEAKEQAIKEGYKSFSTLSFEYEPQEGKPVPNRKGDFWLDFDSKESPWVAIEHARRYIQVLEAKYPDFNRYMVQYFLSGGKGCHLCFPAIIFGDTEGHPSLPLIHRQLFHFLKSAVCSAFDVHPFEVWNFDKILDDGLYKGGKGNVLREKNILRENGRYKVEVECNNFFNLDENSLFELTEKPRKDIDYTPQPQFTCLSKVFDFCKLTITANQREAKLVKHLLDCEFIKYCMANQCTLGEEAWFDMLKIFSKLGSTGLELAHIFSSGHPEYRAHDTRKKFEHAQQYPITCAAIREKHKVCPQSCTKTWPINITSRNELDSTRLNVPAKFFVKEDGLYKFEGEDEEVKISSYIKILGRVRNPDNSGWGRRIELKTPNGDMVYKTIEMTGALGTGEVVLKELVKFGVEPIDKKSCKQILQYLWLCENNNKILTRLEKKGWYGSTFVLPDVIYGEQNHSLVFEEEDTLFGTAGTLEGWKKEIGSNAVGNPLVMFCLQYALIAVLLTLLDLEGGGLNIYGPSSCGKTSIAYAAGSVVGGNENSGFIRPWSTTPNALEVLATKHNDLFLVLDELGRAMDSTIIQAAYTLASGMGKERMDQNIDLRKKYTWRLQFLSTGEIPLEEKIEESGRYKSKAGQEIRLISIPALGDGEIFKCLHGFHSSAELADHFKRMAKKYYGTVLRAFLDALFGNNGEDLEKNTELLKSYLKEFMEDNCKDGESGQVKRGRTQFALAAIAGRFACNHGLFPWDEKSAVEVARIWFEIWLKTRGSIGNMEIEKGINAIYDYIQEHGKTRFVGLKLDIERFPHNFSGYISNEYMYSIYYFKPIIFEKIVGKTYSKKIKEVLKERGLLDYDVKNKQLQKTVHPKMTKKCKMVGIIVKDDIDMQRISRPEIIIDKPF